MPVKLNHTIVDSGDKKASAAFVARILGLGEPQVAGHFVTVEVANGVSLDFDDREVVHPQHYAFTVDDAEFDAIFERVKAEGIEYYADPQHQHPGTINTRHYGRGFYFDGPNRHNLEVFTLP